ncbi:hypothetical protein RHCRD62_30615 [Rhodococcus sp. RD6.2]|nr:hypothetical protein RHCRD62_30615 [Rhodococcus sp. RD6.2]
MSELGVSRNPLVSTIYGTPQLENESSAST